VMHCASRGLQLPPPLEASGGTVPNQLNRLIFFKL